MSDTSSDPSIKPQQSQPQRNASRSRNRGRSRARRNSSVASTISDAGPEEVPSSGDKRRKRKNKNKQQQNALPVVDEVEATGKELADTAGGAVQAVGNTAGAVTNAVGGGSDKPLKLRLDLNLDVDIRLTAKVHGDVTLTLLEDADPVGESQSREILFEKRKFLNSRYHVSSPIFTQEGLTL
ncbi:hypothetical protein AGABI2DRAFT_178034 [Agaricus bisporus var. bisporus H97]|uniref:hypothetical protein n=1 Tax=Agaricus bisporus var. bisporus (strain H97 / ATCC MYA-4626 / FGSC 10389) TaxID=936046 RepID=UPI00029F755B|nr:hypothetical protein AGABI2DRAFT_178034 [Agaricus bisporus var. bisporus H97]EKV48633.1 hypothetical protein AGABI2DRAFT_178034 [Agaricus bisporus var. bisporus H97]